MSKQGTQAGKANAWARGHPGWLGAHRFLLPAGARTPLLGIALASARGVRAEPSPKGQSACLETGPRWPLHLHLPRSPTVAGEAERVTQPRCPWRQGWGEARRWSRPLGGPGLWVGPSVPGAGCSAVSGFPEMFCRQAAGTRPGARGAQRQEPRPLANLGMPWIWDCGR